MFKCDKTGHTAKDCRSVLSLGGNVVKPAKKAAVVIEKPSDEKSGEANGGQRLEASVCMTQQAEGPSE